MGNPANRAMRALRRAVLAAPSLLAAGCLLLGCGALALRGAARYDDRTAGAALDSFAFWFVLLAALIACAPLFQADNRTTDEGHRADEETAGRSVLSMLEMFHFAWLYPLARLYSLGPWNSGWSFATLLLGGALALWCACSALVQPEVVARNARIQSIYLALALAGLGLSNSAGVAAACYGVLAYLVLSVGHGDGGQAQRRGELGLGIIKYLPTPSPVPPSPSPGYSPARFRSRHRSWPPGC